MSERTRNLTAAGIIAASLITIVIALASSPPSSADRVAHLATILKCPVCTSESIASSPSGIAREALTLIEERVAEGWSDDEIIDFFVTTYGDDMLLDPPTGGRTTALWVLPLLAAVAGIAVIASRRRRSGASSLSEADRRSVEEALALRERS